MEKRANYTSSQTAHPVYRVGLETKRQMGINPVMSVKTGVGAKQKHYTNATLFLNQTALRQELRLKYIKRKESKERAKRVEWFNGYMTHDNCNG